MNFVKPTILLAALALGCSISVSAQNQESKPAEVKSNSHIKTKYDKGKDLSTVSVKTIALSSAMTKEVTDLKEVPQLDLDAYFTHPGQVVSKQVETLTLRFRVRAKAPVFQRGQNLILVINNDRALGLGVTNYASSSQTFFFDEFLTIDIPFEILRRMVQANSLKLYLGPRQVDLTSAHQEDFKALMSRMTP